MVTWYIVHIVYKAYMAAFDHQVCHWGHIAVKAALTRRVSRRFGGRMVVLDLQGHTDLAAPSAGLALCP
jgi:hypothetical protein